MLLCFCCVREQLVWRKVGGRQGALDFFYVGADMRGGRGCLTRLKSKRPSCNLNAIIHPQHPPTPPTPPTLQSVFAAAAGAARRNQAGVSSSSPALPEQRWGGEGSGGTPPSCRLHSPAPLFLLDIILPAEQKEGREEGTLIAHLNGGCHIINAYRAALQAVTGTPSHWGVGGVNGILTPVKGGTAIGGLELNSSLHRR